MPLVLAHQGGWDELVLFAGPIIIVIAWVRWAERRAKQRKLEGESGPANLPGDTDA